MSDEFLRAVKQGDKAKVAALLASQPSLATARDASGVSAVLLALYHGHRAVAEVLVANHRALDIFEASAVGSAERAQTLLAADPRLLTQFSADGWTPLHLASFFGQRAVVETLLASGASVSTRSQNAMTNAPLHAAVAGGHSEEARLLVDRGAEINARQAGGFTPLHGAAAQGNVELVSLLLARGADVNARADDGMTPMALAVQKSRTEVARLLREQGGVE